MRGSRPTGAEPHRPASINLLREVKVDSPVHRLWAGTKILVVVGLSITLSYFPSWGAIGLVAVALVGAVLAARIPAGAWPRPPRWFWVVLVATGFVSSLAGGAPHIHVGGRVLGLGALDTYGRFVAVGVLLLLAALVLGWTTPVGEIAPAVAVLLRPLRLLRVPVDEAATVLALCVRSLPLLVNEMRTLVAARRLRPFQGRPGLTAPERWLEDVVDLMVAALAVSVRRSGELAEAITARGGIGLIAARVRRPGRADALVLVGAGAMCWSATLFRV